MSFRTRLNGSSPIADAIVMIEQFTLGMDFEAFRSNPMAVAAVERKLQISLRGNIVGAVTGDLPPLKIALVRELSH